MEIGIGMYDIILTAQSHVEGWGSESGKIRESIFENVRTENRDGNCYFLQQSWIFVKISNITTGSHKTDGRRRCQIKINLAFL